MRVSRISLTDDAKTLTARDGPFGEEPHSFAARNLSALAITETELKLMAAAIIGLPSSPGRGRGLHWLTSVRVTGFLPL
jgi:hypothetical protein